MPLPDRPRWLTPALLADPWRTIEAALPWSDPQAQPLREIDAACRDLEMRTGYKARHLLMAPSEMSSLMRCDEVVQCLRIYGAGEVSFGGVLSDIHGVAVHLDDTVILPGRFDRLLYVMAGEAVVANVFPQESFLRYPDAPASCVILRGLAPAENLRLRR